MSEFFNVIVFISLYIVTPYQQVDSPKATRKPANEFRAKFTKKVCSATRAARREEPEESWAPTVRSRLAAAVRAGSRGLIAITLD